ncbi:hypothetical protein B0I35DRAFT_397873 [Stachybotrys elegans]|uniref:Zn(2)-C6 fungal-type domain-containing protein n=1 Tax=Stachybotrys elegans TaxID=80388 RepID=A0A8K0WM67_9HYPO|nr:hypothetical protein B0I35DRAFT_397873 [Stachybotrys elegans]
MDRNVRRRRRPALSCIECRRRKVKCDRNEPCHQCRSLQAHCEYSEDTVRAAPKPARAPGSTVQGAAVITPASSAEDGGQAVVSADAVRVIAGFDQSDPGRCSPRRELAALNQRVRSLELQTASNKWSHSANHQPATADPGLNDSTITLKKTRMMGWSRWMASSEEFKLVATTLYRGVGDTSFTSDDPEVASLISETRHLNRQCKILASNMKKRRSPVACATGISALPVPSRPVADTMAQHYFASFESSYRVLHAPSFWNEYEQYWENPEMSSESARLKILLVVAIGSGVNSHIDDDISFRDMAVQWINAAGLWLSTPGKHQLDIPDLQVHCLTMLARQVLSVGGDLIWISMGSLIHKAMQIALHRDPKYLPPMKTLQAELRRRLWFTIVEMTVQASLDSSMPPRITLDEFDTEPPANCNDEDLDDTAQRVTSKLKEVFTSTSMQLVLLETLPTRLAAVQLINGLHSELSYSNVLSLSSNLLDACRVLDAFTKTHGRLMTPFHRNLLDFLHRRFLIPLHCPFASQAKINQLFHYSRRVIVDASMNIISPEPDEGFSRLLTLGGGLFREGLRYACSAITMELIVTTEMQQADGTLHRTSQQRELLKKAAKDIRKISEARIRLGETNVKLVPCLDMFLAQVEAIETGLDCDRAVAQAMRDSFQHCVQLLEEREALTSADSHANSDEALIWDGQVEMDWDVGYEFLFPTGDF